MSAVPCYQFPVIDKEEFTMLEHTVSNAHGGGAVRTHLPVRRRHVAEIMSVCLQGAIAIAAGTLHKFKSRSRDGELARLNNELLQDIGLSREDVGPVENFHKWNDPFDVEIRRMQ
ncbi:DUF1127 domain-containing protein [Hoeflea sp. TYP-13]|uniref:DUF1127 domain-containing protein n=1 Tax=Hoeflea sp. TYP-13 TaxID=3230023 RepID=UPI0034C63BCE